MELKKMNQKQGIGLFFAGIGTLVGVISNHMPKPYGWVMLGMAILLLITGVFLCFKYRK